MLKPTDKPAPRYTHILPVCDWCGADITKDRLAQLGARVNRCQYLCCSRLHAKLARKRRWRDKPGNLDKLKESMRRLRAERKLKIMLDKAFGDV